MKKNRIRLTESQLNRVIKESVKRVLSEGIFDKFTNDDIYNGDIEDIVYELCNNVDIDVAEDNLAKIGRLKFVDEKIDDGIGGNNSKDSYVKLRSYDLTTKDGAAYYIRLYYGDYTRIVSYCDIRMIIG